MDFVMRMSNPYHGLSTEGTLDLATHQYLESGDYYGSDVNGIFGGVIGAPGTRASAVISAALEILGGYDSNKAAVQKAIESLCIILERGERLYPWQYKEIMESTQISEEERQDLRIRTIGSYLKNPNTNLILELL